MFRLGDAILLVGHLDRKSTAAPLQQQEANPSQWCRDCRVICAGCNLEQPAFTLRMQCPRREYDAVLCSKWQEEGAIRPDYKKENKMERETLDAGTQRRTATLGHCVETRWKCQAEMISKCSYWLLSFWNQMESCHSEAETSHSVFSSNVQMYFKKKTTKRYSITHNINEKQRREEK